MRVLHVIPSISVVHGGPSHVLGLMEQGLCAQGVIVTTVTTDDDGPSRRLKIDACPGKVHGARRIYFRKWFDFYKVAPAMLPWLWRNIRTFDVVHIHSLFSFSSVAAGLVAIWRGVPYIVRPLGTLGQYGMAQRHPRLKRISLAALEARILCHAAAVHFTSEMESEEAQWLNLPFRAVVIPLAATKEAEGDTKLLLHENPILNDRQVVLFLSRLDLKKNIEGLLRAFTAVGAGQPDVVLMIAGDGRPDYAQKLRRLAKALGVESRVVWLGRVEGAKKAAAFATAHVFALPSLSENFGIAAAEAMLAGLPCVLGEGVAIARPSMQAGASITVTPDPESIALALKELLANRPKREAMGRRAREFAEQEYSLQIMASRLTSLYRRILTEKSREVP